MTFSNNNIKPRNLKEWHGGRDAIYKCIWWYIRSHHIFTIRELCSIYVVSSVGDSRKRIFNYLMALDNAEIIERRALNRKGRKRLDFIEWHLVVDLGPKAPEWSSSRNEIFDHNSGSKYLIDNQAALISHPFRRLNRMIDVALRCHKKIANQPDDYWFNVRKIYRWLSGDSFLECGNFFAPPISARITGIEKEEFSWLRMVDTDISPEQVRLFVGIGILVSISKLLLQYKDRNSISLDVVTGVVALCGLKLPVSFYESLMNQSLDMWRWKTDCYQKLLAKTNKRRAALFFCDVSNITLDDIFLKSNSDDRFRKRGSLIKSGLGDLIIYSILSPSGSFRFMIYQKSTNVDSCILFLSWLMSLEEDGVTLVVDPAQFKTGEVVRNFVKSHMGKLRIYSIFKK